MSLKLAEGQSSACVRVVEANDDEEETTLLGVVSRKIDFFFAASNLLTLKRSHFGFQMHELRLKLMCCSWLCQPFPPPQNYLLRCI